MNYETLEMFRRRLLDRRLRLVRHRQGALADEQDLLAELEPDWEDTAAKESAARALESLGETDRLAVLHIEKALERMERGDYGECAVCREHIDEERLRAVPETEVCGGCAAAC